jgi:hypothetical protein
MEQKDEHKKIEKDYINEKKFKKDEHKKIEEMASAFQSCSTSYSCFYLFPLKNSYFGQQKLFLTGHVCYVLLFTLVVHCQILSSEFLPYFGFSSEIVQLWPTKLFLVILSLSRIELSIIWCYRTAL